MGFLFKRSKSVFDFFQVFFVTVGILSSLTLLFICVRPYLKLRKQYHPRPVITPFEAKMFKQLKAAFPDLNVLAQVAFSALITSDQYKIRGRFNRKVTDFVILNQKLDVVVIIELDDPSHLIKQQEDKFRDQMLQEAGYRVLRYTQIPSVRQLHKDIQL